MLLTTIDRAGVDSAIARYRALRMDTMSGRYNFQAQPVLETARTLAARGRYDDAIALLKMIQEFFPNMAPIDEQFADVYLAKGDRDDAIAHLRAALAKTPNDPRLRMRLQQLGVTP